MSFTFCLDRIEKHYFKNALYFFFFFDVLLLWQQDFLWDHDNRLASPCAQREMSLLLHQCFAFFFFFFEYEHLQVVWSYCFSYSQLWSVVQHSHSHGSLHGNKKHYNHDSMKLIYIASHKFMGASNWMPFEGMVNLQVAYAVAFKVWFFFFSLASPLVISSQVSDQVYLKWLISSFIFF